MLTGQTPVLVTYLTSSLFFLGVWDILEASLLEHIKFWKSSQCHLWCGYWRRVHNTDLARCTHMYISSYSQAKPISYHIEFPSLNWVYRIIEATAGQLVEQVWVRKIKMVILIFKSVLCIFYNVPKHRDKLNSKSGPKQDWFESEVMMKNRTFF